MSVSQWFLTSEERGNPATAIDRRHADGLAWSAGNQVRALVHGARYFSELLTTLEGTQAGDLVLFTDWRGDPDERLEGPRTSVTRVLCDAARRGVIVRGLLWRSHPDALHFSAPQNRQLADDIQSAGGHCLLDMRVRFGGSHHQKLFVVRHQGRPELDVAYVGGIDLCRGRNDDDGHRGDPQAPPMSDVYGDRPPWHDIQLAIHGPAVGDVETVFRERWDDTSALTRNPVDKVRDLVQGLKDRADPLPEQLPDPPRAGRQLVQTLRTYPARRFGRYPFAPEGERSVARGYLKALGEARKLIYLEDQYLWSAEVLWPFAQALKDNPDLHLIAVVPLAPDAANPMVASAQALGRTQAMKVLAKAGGDRVAVYGLENQAGTPIYVHAKSCLIDDTWATVGSDNFNLRSWTYDSELTCAVYSEPADDSSPAGTFALDLRMELVREHLDRAEGDDTDLRDPMGLFTAFAKAAQALDDWHDAGGLGPRPAGRLRRYHPPRVGWWRRLPAQAVYRLVCDPDGRPGSLRRRYRF